MRLALAFPLLVLALLVAPAAAQAAPPPNDARANAQDLGNLPASARGTTTEATREQTDPPSGTGANGPNVWYRFTAQEDGRVVVTLTAEGDLDAAVDAYLRTRSQLTRRASDATDEEGRAVTDFRVRRGESFLIAVTQRENSVPGNFTLSVVAPQPAARPPGPPLPAGGITRTLDRVQELDDAWSVVMRAGRTYRIRLSGRGESCAPAARVYQPGTRDFDDASPRVRVRCDGYATITPRPGEAGRWSILVRASRTERGSQPYHLEVAGAGPDDTAPGLRLPNFRTVSGGLRGSRVDAVDLYRFAVGRRSALTLRLRTANTRSFQLVLLTERGNVVENAGGDGETGNVTLRRRIAPGRYFVAVRAPGRSNGGYRLVREQRLITRIGVSMNGERSARTRPGNAVNVRVQVTPGVSGPVILTFTRFDPLEGYLFLRLVRVRAVNGVATVSFVPPAVGRYRVRARFTGTRTAGRSRSGFARVLVAGPAVE